MTCLLKDTVLLKDPELYDSYLGGLDVEERHLLSRTEDFILFPRLYQPIHVSSFRVPGGLRNCVVYGPD